MKKAQVRHLHIEDDHRCVVPPAADVIAQPIGGSGIELTMLYGDRDEFGELIAKSAVAVSFDAEQAMKVLRFLQLAQRCFGWSASEAGVQIVSTYQSGTRH
ncbi:hypothetical protein [Inquilinus sp. OTU3971]|uniref:hypothetical protein n=1 Tax=Inquilinus sp. OTU3971 TaxID=3043855 RepID=UPI00313E6DC6